MQEEMSERIRDDERNEREKHTKKKTRGGRRRENRKRRRREKSFLFFRHLTTFINLTPESHFVFSTGSSSHDLVT